MIDAAVISPKQGNLPIIFGYWMPGIGTTLSFVMLACLIEFTCHHFHDSG
jgi:hypothetical protein